MPVIFFLLSGEHPTLPKAELFSILDSGNYRYKVLEELPQVIRLETDMKCATLVEKRAAMTRTCCLEVFHTEAEVRKILSRAEAVSFGEFLEADKSFAVRVRRVGRSAQDLDKLALERLLGAKIVEDVKDIKADLKRPQQLLLGVLTGNRFLFGLSLDGLRPKGFTKRDPMKRPYFHPAALPAKLARCLVNLASPKEGDLLLDPFCGAGSVLIEAGLIGCRVLGLDADRNMVEGSERNLSYYGIDPEGLVVTDSRLLPIREVDCVVTDPPYGRSASTFNSETREIMETLLKRLVNVVKGRIVAGSPHTIELKRVGEGAGLRCIGSHLIYVHRSLTREICLFEVA